MLPTKPIFSKPLVPPRFIPRVHVSVLNGSDKRFSNVVLTGPSGMAVIDIEPDTSQSFEIDLLPNEAKFSPQSVCTIPGLLEYDKVLVQARVEIPVVTQGAPYHAIISLLITKST